MEQRRSLGLYIHIPFCERKCGYCDFLSSPPACMQETDEYVDALVNEILGANELSHTHLVDTVYIGGGTPSLLSVQQLLKITDTIKNTFELHKDYEWTIEVNPNSVTKEKLKAYKKAGINRLSIGLQAAQNRLLTVLGRVHTFEIFEHSIFLIQEAGFDNYNIDVMYGLPTQTIKEWEETIEKVLRFSPKHISAYSLILEEGTPFYDRFIKQEASLLPTEEEIEAMEDRLLYKLSEYGYERYEISNFARNGYEAKHNKRYWRLLDYRGFGLGASSYFFGDPGNRFDGDKSLKRYLQCEFRYDQIAVTTENQMEEYCFLGLRLLKEGIDLIRFQTLFQKDFYSVYPPKMVKKHKEDGLLEEIKTTTAHTLRLTKRGAEVANYVMADFLISD